MGTFCKKIRLYPIGDQEEVNRVYEYIRNGMYVQYTLMNKLMSQIMTLYYSDEVDRDVKSDAFKNGRKEILRISNPVFHDEPMPKGLGMQSTVTRKVSQDFSTALKNGLASGDRSAPYYRRSCGLMVPGVRFQFYMSDDTYCIKFCNGIHFKVITGRGKRDYYLTDLLDALSSGNEDYHIGTSQLTIDGKYIYLILTVSKEDVEVSYEPDKDRVMGIAFGYESPTVCCIRNLTKPQVSYIEIGDSTPLVKDRMQIQENMRMLTTGLKNCTGGRGRKHKLQALDRYTKRERNFVRTYNHKLSKDIVSAALDAQVSDIVMEKVEKQDVSAVMLRNWSWYELQSMVSYKAAKYGITVSVDDRKIGHVCSQCGCVQSEQADSEFNTSGTFFCTECGHRMPAGQNKALILVSDTKEKA